MARNSLVLNLGHSLKETITIIGLRTTNMDSYIKLELGIIKYSLQQVLRTMNAGEWIMTVMPFGLHQDHLIHSSGTTIKKKEFINTLIINGNPITLGGMTPYMISPL